MSVGTPLRASDSHAIYIETVGNYRCDCGKDIYVIVGTVPYPVEEKWIIDSLHRGFVFVRESLETNRPAKTIAYDFVESTNIQFERYQDSVPELAECEWVTKWD